MAVPGGPGLLLISFPLLYGLRLDAIRYSKSLRSAPQAKDAWARVIARGQEDPSQLQDVREVNYETLRLARVRLHAFQCSETFFHSQQTDVIDLIIFSDGSPQWRGVEMLASSFDLRIPGTAYLISE